ncbi:MAG: FAD:protein FMN transferase [Brevinema sp.]
MKKISIVLLILITSCTSKTISKHVYQKNIMYTVFDVVIYSNLPKFKISNYVNKVWDRLIYLEKEMSPAENGFLGKLNQEAQISRSENPEIFDILSNFIILSKNVNQQSGGAFDLTVYPLIRLWGFYLQDEQKVPTQDEIIKTLSQISMNHIIVSNDMIYLKNNAKIDLGAIAKGYAVDEAVKMLTNFGISAGIVNAGGNVRVFGHKPEGEPWKVGIRNPSGAGIEEVVILNNGEAIATSGDYERFFVYEDKIYHHIFNPKTGHPVSHSLASVSVIVAQSAELSDVLSTTLLVVGNKEASKFLTKFDPPNNYPLFFIERHQDQLQSSFNTFWAERRVISGNK